MAVDAGQYGHTTKGDSCTHRLYGLLARRACTVIMFGALFCTLAVKFFHSWRQDCINEYPRWIPADIAVLLGIELVLAAVCFYRPRKWVIRTACIIAAVVCTWSVMNAGWLIRTGTQILPAVLLPLVRDPKNAMGIIGVSLVKMPAAAVALLAPSAVALAFFFFVLARPLPPNYTRRYFIGKIVVSAAIITVAVLACFATAPQGSTQTASLYLRYNSQLRAITSLVLPGPDRLAKADLLEAKRKIPAFDQLNIELSAGQPQVNHNVVIVVLEGIQYKYTSLADDTNDLTPYLAKLADAGAEFTNTRSSVTHTTKVLFSLLTGRFPSVSQDIAEAVPAAKPYAGLATILKSRLNFRTAFFQSAKGNFESRPGLVYNLGFDKFWARDDLNDPNAYLGYLACDEFAMLKPITEWIKADSRPFLLTIMCSVSHDPYEVPKWFALQAKEPLERYRQTISYTDEFIAALDAELAELDIADKTVFCVIGDHGEAFGEHDLLGHERIAFEEVLRIPWVIKAPFLIEPQKKVTRAVSSIDLTPTLLTLLGFDISKAGFDGVNVFGMMPDDRKVYFSGWLRQSPAGFVKGAQKFIYDPANKKISVYDLNKDPLELLGAGPPGQQARVIAEEIIAWRKNSIFLLDRQRTGETRLYDHWLCHWTDRVASTSYDELRR